MTLVTEQPEKKAGTLKEQLDSITPALREMRMRKEERLNQFRAVQSQIQKIPIKFSQIPNKNAKIIKNSRLVEFQAL